MCEKAAEKDSRALHCVPYQFKIQEILQKLLKKIHEHFIMSHIILRQRKCVKEQLKKAYRGCSTFLMILRHER